MYSHIYPHNEVTLIFVSRYTIYTSNLILHIVHRIELNKITFSLPQGASGYGRPVQRTKIVNVSALRRFNAGKKQGTGGALLFIRPPLSTSIRVGITSLSNCHARLVKTVRLHVHPCLPILDLPTLCSLHPLYPLFSSSCLTPDPLNLPTLSSPLSPAVPPPSYPSSDRLSFRCQRMILILVPSMNLRAASTPLGV
jgi:hypothetical protein